MDDLEDDLDGRSDVIIRVNDQGHVCVTFAPEDGSETVTVRMTKNNAGKLAEALQDVARSDA
jgi:hypothetical protein